MGDEVRLTTRDEFGNADIIGVDSARLQLHLDYDEINRVTEALNRLARYEDEHEKGGGKESKKG